MTGGFLLAVIATVLAIVIAAPKYAEPATAADLAAVASNEPSLDVQADGTVVQPEIMLSKPPSQLKGYRWPVRGGYMDTFYGRDSGGRFEIDGKRVHDGIVITWFVGAAVKAAHNGEVVSAGQEWARDAGYDGSLDDVYERVAEQQAKTKGKKKNRKAGAYPLGVVIDDGNGYYSIYTELKNLRVKAGDKVKAGQTIGEMTSAESKAMMRYRLVRMDGLMMKVHQTDRKRGYPGYARERVDPLAVLNIDAKRRPKRAEKAPANAPRLSEY
jgi:murein DD-endopeptidase MepM/ murein hydrolase activator NlpD